MFATATTSSYNVNKSHEVPQGPSDGISSLAWFPLTQNNQTFLAAGSWDKSVRVWDVRYEPMTSSAQFQAKAIFQHDAPVLSCVFSKVRWWSEFQFWRWAKYDRFWSNVVHQQNALFSGSCDSVVKMHNLTTNQSQNIGKVSHQIKIESNDSFVWSIIDSIDSTINFVQMDNLLMICSAWPPGLCRRIWWRKKYLHFGELG